MKKIFMLCLILASAMNAVCQSQGYIDAQIQAQNDVANLNLRYSPKRNIYLGANDNVIHIFLFEDGNLLLAGYPTTATEKSLFQVHLYVTNTTDQYLLQYTGSYQPTLNIQSGSSAANLLTRTPGITISRIDFPRIGPFTDNVVLTLKKADAAGNYNALVSATIQISKTIHVSIGSGMVFTTLHNPKNIKAVPKTGSDSTLIADDPGGRALLTIMATFYPWGRNNLMVPDWNFKDRFGIVAGTTLGTGSSNFGDILVGGQYDFSAGGSFVAGLHYGRRQKIAGIDYSSFKFGESKFTGDLTNKSFMGWDGGFFIGIQVDTRIFSQLFAK